MTGKGVALRLVRTVPRMTVSRGTNSLVAQVELWAEELRERWNYVGAHARGTFTEAFPVHYLAGAGLANRVDGAAGGSVYLHAGNRLGDAAQSARSLRRVHAIGGQAR